MKTFISFFIPCLLLASCASDSVSKQEREKASYEQTKKTLQEKEKDNPLLFISITGAMKKNLIGQAVIRGKLSSTATVAVYKDINIKLDFFSKTKALLESDKEIIYVALKPGTTESFKTKYFAPKGTDSVSLSVISATTVD
ncbi:MAG: hypothetical protein H3C36_04315 [Chitinophagaceae bacterium]|nr:hypothetical protein [Chitinophagaceae bacterium]MCW5914856.1 hypothetical protein [Chitinophagaceae bacterium]MCZ2396198.1 hypothetical protein [Chitinophagales bacterium]